MNGIQEKRMSEYVQAANLLYGIKKKYLNEKGYNRMKINELSSKLFRLEITI